MKIYSKREITTILFNNYLNNYGNVKGIPTLYRGKGFRDLEGEKLIKIVEKCKTWDYQNPLICTIVSNQNGIGKTHLAAGILKNYIYRFYLEKEDENYKMHLTRNKFAEEEIKKAELEEEKYNKMKVIYKEEFEKLNEVNKKSYEYSGEGTYLYKEDLSYRFKFIKEKIELMTKLKRDILLVDYEFDRMKFNIMNKTIQFIPERTLLMEYRESLNFKSNKTESDIIREYSRYDLLCIDDIFSSREGGNCEQARSVLLAILDERTTNTMKPTILTSNLTIEEIANIDTRLASRMRNSMLIEIASTMEDYRGRE